MVLVSCRDQREDLRLAQLVTTRGGQILIFLAMQADARRVVRARWAMEVVNY